MCLSMCISCSCSPSISVRAPEGARTACVCARVLCTFQPTVEIEDLIIKQFSSQTREQQYSAHADHFVAQPNSSAHRVTARRVTSDVTNLGLLDDVTFLGDVDSVEKLPDVFTVHLCRLLDESGRA